MRGGVRLRAISILGDTAKGAGVNQPIILNCESGPNEARCVQNLGLKLQERGCHISK